MIDVVSGERHKRDNLSGQT